MADFSQCLVSFAQFIVCHKIKCANDEDECLVPFAQFIRCAVRQTLLYSNKHKCECGGFLPTFFYAFRQEEHVGIMNISCTCTYDSTRNNIHIAPIYPVRNIIFRIVCYNLFCIFSSSFVCSSQDSISFTRECAKSVQGLLSSVPLH